MGNGGGALGISLGLALYGPKVIRTIGSEITDLDQTRAYCVAMSATITVIIASQMGMPVSSLTSAVVMASPAEGPSLGMAASGA